MPSLRQLQLEQAMNEGMRETELVRSKAAFTGFGRSTIAADKSDKAQQEYTKRVNAIVQVSVLEKALEDFQKQVAANPDNYDSKFVSARLQSLQEGIDKADEVATTLGVQSKQRTATLADELTQVGLSEASKALGTRKPMQTRMATLKTPTSRKLTISPRYTAPKRMKEMTFSKPMFAKNPALQRSITDVLKSSRSKNFGRHKTLASNPA